jgi:hypothetical protein
MLEKAGFSDIWQIRSLTACGKSDHSRCIMLTLGSLSILLITLLGCVWWVSHKDSDGAL